MKRLVETFVLLIVVVGPACAQGTASGQIVADTIPAPSLAGNLLGDPTQQPAFVYLPPGYESDGTGRYAVVYLLHGILDSPSVWVDPAYQDMTIDAVMDSLIAVGEVRPMIVVMVNGANAYGASLYMNSPVTGDWGDYVARDMVRHVDTTYRTIPNRTSRAIVGHSMGGFGAINLAMEHPDIFSVAWGMNPCCLCCIELETPPGHPIWRNLGEFGGPEAMWRHLEEEDDPWPLIVAGAGAVLAPAPDRPPLYFDPPFLPEGDSVVTTDAAERMEDRLPLARMADRVQSLRSLQGLGMDLAFDDQFAHIPPATAQFSDSLTALEVPHVFEAYEGDHRNRMSERLPRRVLPWVDNLLEHQGRGP